MLKKYRTLIVIMLVILLAVGCDLVSLGMNTPTPEVITMPTSMPASNTITTMPAATSASDRTLLATLTPALATIAASMDFNSLPNEDKGAINYTDANSQISYIVNHIKSDVTDIEERCAYITGFSYRSDGNIDVMFDYADWLFNPEATVQYKKDYPSAQPADYEFIEQIGYIRNVNSKIRTFKTCVQSQYFLNRPAMTSSIGEVGFNEFKDYLSSSDPEKFVVVCTVDGVIARVEWIFLP